MESFARQLNGDVDKELLNAWLKTAHMKATIEALLTVAQEQAINANYHSAKILKTTDNPK